MTAIEVKTERLKDSQTAFFIIVSTLGQDFTSNAQNTCSPYLGNPANNSVSLILMTETPHNTKQWAFSLILHTLLLLVRRQEDRKGDITALTSSCIFAAQYSGHGQEALVDT